jgi:hypothetical protein
MPNWCVGNIKFRGPIQNVYNCLKDICVSSDIESIKDSDSFKWYSDTYIQAVKCLRVEYRPPDDESSDYFEIFISTNYEQLDKLNDPYYKTKRDWTFWFKDSIRQFVEANYISGYVNKNDGLCYAVLPIKGAWGIATEYFRNNAEKYKVDIKCYAFERGMEYNQEFEYDRNGNVIVSREIKFDNYNWDCVMPDLGG